MTTTELWPSSVSTNFGANKLETSHTLTDPSLFLRAKVSPFHLFFPRGYRRLNSKVMHAIFAH